MSPPASGEPWAPDLVIVGAARSGTSFLSGTLGQHPRIDVGSVKEPNFFSSRWSQGADWYDGLFLPRPEGSRRVDASVSYTYPQHGAALQRIREAAPHAQVVLAVREPLARLVSHFHLFRYYHGLEAKWPTLETAIARSDMFLGSGDYGHWLARLADTFPLEQVLVVPFPATTQRVGESVAVLLDRLGLEPGEAELSAPEFRNDVREFAVPGIAAVQQRLHRSTLYPRLRRALGPQRLRAARELLTRPTRLPSVEEELAALSPGLRARLSDHAAASVRAVDAWLDDQDARLDMQWSPLWKQHVTAGPVIG